MARLFEHQIDGIAAPKIDSETKQESIQESKHGPIKIVPVSLFWGHQPNREKSLSSLLLSDNWTVTSRFKKLLAMAIHPGHILVQFSEPVVLTDIIEVESNRENRYADYYVYLGYILITRNSRSSDPTSLTGAHLSMRSCLMMAYKRASH